jgi:SAM-dependent methyltransferase
VRADSEALDGQAAGALGHQRQLIEECVRVLRPGGVAYSSSRNPLHFGTLTRWGVGGIFRRDGLGTRGFKAPGFRTVCDFYVDLSLSAHLDHNHTLRRTPTPDGRLASSASS